MNVVPATLVVMTAAATVAAVIDMRTRRIPNALTGALVIAALLSHAFGPLPELIDALAVMLAVFIAGTIAFALGWFGGGDVKLLAACAAVVGSHGITALLIDVFIAGGVLAVFEATRRRSLLTFLRSTAGALGGVRPVAQFHVPYGVAIAAGTLVYSASFLLAGH